jgi:hypothetical protein
LSKLRRNPFFLVPAELVTRQDLTDTKNALRRNIADMEKRVIHYLKILSGKPHLCNFLTHHPITPVLFLKIIGI